MIYFTVGQLAAKTNVSKVAIRYYERLGLIPKAERSAAGYRTYPEAIVSRLRFIINAKAVGFTLQEIRELFALQEQKYTTSLQIKNKTLDKLKLTQEKIMHLQKIAKALEHLASSCDGTMPLEDCPILETLYDEMNEIDHHTTHGKHHE